MDIEPVLIAGSWQPSQASGTFQAINPQTGHPLPARFPVSTWADCERALAAAADAAESLRQAPASQIADLLDAIASQIEARAESLVETAHLETGLPKSPRLADGELPRTTGQLRQAAEAARHYAWQRPTIDTGLNIRSCYGAIGPVCVFGPNNFPFAFGSVSGGDFAAAIAAGNPVIGKANSSHPATTRLFAEAALAALQQIGLPPATVQLLYRTDHRDGLRLVADPRVGATGYTGSRSAGLQLKQAADAAGKLIYLELSSLNPVVVLPGALQERRDQIVEELVSSALMGTGQFCTNPGLVLLLDTAESHQLLQQITDRYDQTPPGVLLSAGVQANLQQAIATLTAHGAERLTAEASVDGPAIRCRNTLLRVCGADFLKHCDALQTEAFGNATLAVVARSLDELLAVIRSLEGNLTGCIYTSESGSDESAYRQVASQLRPKVGRLLNDKMPTGVAVSPAMNHGGPFPATGHPGFTAVGIPASIQRFAMLECYDNVRPDRLPACLQDRNPTGETWRFVDQQWTQAHI